MCQRQKCVFIWGGSLTTHIHDCWLGGFNLHPKGLLFAAAKSLLLFRLSNGLWRNLPNTTPEAHEKSTETPTWSGPGLVSHSRRPQRSPAKEGKHTCPPQWAGRRASASFQISVPLQGLVHARPPCQCTPRGPDNSHLPSMPTAQGGQEKHHSSQWHPDGKNPCIIKSLLTQNKMSWTSDASVRPKLGKPWNPTNTVAIWSGRGGGSGHLKA